MSALWLLLCAWGGPVADGVERFDAGDLAGAIQAWGPPSEAGWGTARVKYNLGNAYYRRGDLPRAIAAWRAAGRVHPRSGSVHHNLALARSELRGVPTPAGDGALWTRVLTPGELGVVGVLLAALGSVRLVLRRRRPERSRAGALGTWAVGVLLGLLAVWGWWEQVRHPLAVVVDQPAPARVTPSIEADARFTLQPGSEVMVLQQAGDFVLVETGEGQRGWLTDGAVYRVPR